MVHGSRFAAHGSRFMIRREIERGREGGKEREREKQRETGRERERERGTQAQGREGGEGELGSTEI